MANRTSAPGAGAGRAPRYAKARGKLPARREGEVKETRPRLSPEERQRLIAEAAYFIAERRGFSAGSELDDWLQAEAEVERRLAESHGG